MGWWRTMRAWLGWDGVSGEAAAAVVAADKSHRTAVIDRAQMAKLRAEADKLAAQVRAHNSANRYDDFLKRVIEEGYR